MASSSSTTTQAPRAQQEAGPLPTKRGEIGYVGGSNEQEVEPRSPSAEVIRPARHPADRDALIGNGADYNPPSMVTIPNTSAPTSPSLISTENSVTKKNKRVLFFFEQDKLPKFGGISLTTCLAFVCQLLCLGATIAGWVIAAQRLSGEVMPGFGNSSLFIHMIFAIATLGQLLFLERTIFRIRAERYSHLHPGEILPSPRARRQPNTGIAFAPWNRPPLPTYAAALAQSGMGTGDVEDHLIAAPPPPAYGNTRGSVLLLAGYLRDSLRAQRPVSGQNQMDEIDERPVSYMSLGEYQQAQDTERGRQLEVMLAQPERAALRS